MQIKACALNDAPKNCYIIPFSDKCDYSVSISKEVDDIVKTLLNNGFKGEFGEIFNGTFAIDGELTDIILWGLGNFAEVSNRKVYLSFTKVIKKAIDSKNANISVVLDNALELLDNKSLAVKLFTAPIVVDYSFDMYKTTKVEKTEKTVYFATKANVEEVINEASITAEATNFSRTLINQPSMYMTPTQLANHATAELTAKGVDVKIYGRKEIENLKMGCFLSVSKGAIEEPKLIVMRYMGDKENNDIVGLIGKGITFDSGGYSLKSKMHTMHADMGGAGAVIGAISVIAQMKLKVNVVSIVAACENKIAPDAYVPGDILFSMNGKTVEMLNADAEGRLTLVDAITYGIRKEGITKVIDIATLTGAAKGAVGNKTAPVLTNNEELWNKMQKASELSCEKIWRLDLDDELRVNFNSAIADIKNSNPGGTMGGGTIMAALFIKDFIEDKPWVHIDMAAVNQVNDDPALYKGATGYGVGLLYNLVKELEK